MSLAQPSAGRLDVGRVIGGTFGVIGRNLWAFLGLTLLLVFAPTFLIGLVSLALVGADPTGMVGAAAAPFVSLAIALVSSAMLQGALVHGAVRDLNGGRAGFGECLSTAFRYALPLVGMLLLISVGLFAAALAAMLVVGLVVQGNPLLMVLVVLALVVGAVVVALRWSVAGPALVAERLGVLRAMQRSAVLTGGTRLHIFALFLIFIVAVSLLFFAIVTISTAAMVAGAGLAALPLLLMIIALQVVVPIIVDTALAVVYVELRRLKEGVGADTVASVFD